MTERTAASADDGQLPAGAPKLAVGTASTARVDGYLAATEFLFREAELLDSRRFWDWLSLLTDDVTYQVPVRYTSEGADEHSSTMFHFNESRQTLQWRVERLDTEMAWAEGPPSRTRHFVSNVRVTPRSADELEVRSYLLLYRNRGGEERHDLLSGERYDVLRWTADGWRLTKRTVLLDQVTLGTQNLAIFL